MLLLLQILKLGCISKFYFLPILLIETEDRTWCEWNVMDLFRFISITNKKKLMHKFAVWGIQMWIKVSTFLIILIIDSIGCLYLVVGFAITLWSKWQENVTVYQQSFVTHFRNVMQFQMFETFNSIIRSILHLDLENFLVHL